MGERLYHFSDLPGVKRRVLRGPIRKSPTGIVNALSKHRLATDAGDDGCVTAWRDDAGHYRAEFQRRYVTIDAHKSTSKAALTRWLKEWHPRMRATP